MDGGKLLRRISRSAVKKIVCNILLLAFFIWFFGYLLLEIIRNFREYCFFLFTAPAWVIALYDPALAIGKHFGVLREGANHDMFRKYGTPDEIAAVLS